MRVEWISNLRGWRIGDIAYHAEYGVVEVTAVTARGFLECFREEIGALPEDVDPCELTNLSRGE